MEETSGEALRASKVVAVGICRWMISDMLGIAAFVLGPCLEPECEGEGDVGRWFEVEVEVGVE